MKITYNSPVILTFTLISSLVLLFDETFLPFLMDWFTVGGSFNPTSPSSYFTLFSHVAGHGDWNHLLGNFTFILLVGPMLEEKHGSSSMLFMILVTAFVTGVLNIIFFDTGLLGASGVVFMLIMLSSFTNFKSGTIPLTFIIIVILFLGKEVFAALQSDNISQFAHILGGITGSLFGFIGNKEEAIVK